VNRYVVISDIPERVGGEDDSTQIVNRTRRMVVDLTTFKVMAHCSDSGVNASKVAEALNDLDGGPL